MTTTVCMIILFYNQHEKCVSQNSENMKVEVFTHFEHALQVKPNISKIKTASHCYLSDPIPCYKKLEKSNIATLTCAQKYSF